MLSARRFALACMVILSPGAAVGQTFNITSPSKFGILVFPTFEPLDVFGPAEALYMLSRKQEIDVYTISNGADLSPVSTAPRSAAMNPYNSSSFQSIVPTHTTAAPPADLEVLLVPGGLGTRATDLNDTIAFVAATYPSLHSLISVCTGARIVVQTGLLDGRRATTNKVAWNATTALGPAVNWDKKARWVQDGNVWTSGGVSAATDAMLAFMADAYGLDVARWTANNMEYEWRDDPNWDPFAYVF